MEDRISELTNNLQSEEDKANRLNKLKNKLESGLQEVDITLMIFVGMTLK